MVESLLVWENRFPSLPPIASAETAVGKEGSRGKITAILSDFQYSLPVLRFFGMFFAFLSS